MSASAIADIGGERLPLSHVRATVLTQAWSGAFATRLLADLGAEVIQVEALSRIDPWRGGYPPRLSGTYPGGEPGARPFDRNAAFNSVNAGKKAITLDLNRPEARDILLDLVSASDIFAENFSARVLPNLGLEYPVLRAANPTIILLRMGAYGATGPYANFMGNGGTIEPMSGVSSLLGYRDGPPMNSGVMHTDPFAGLMAAGAMLTALRHRARTGRGQAIDLSQQETTIGLIADAAMEYSMSGEARERKGNFHPRMAPHDNYPCLGNDNWIAIAARDDDDWSRLCAAMGTPKLARDARFRDAGGRLANVEALDRIISDWTRARERDEAAELLQSRGVPAAPVYRATELGENPQLAERGFFQTIEHPAAGTFPYAGVGWKLSRAPGAVPTRPAPTLGQHSREVLAEYLGIAPETIEDLWREGVTGDTP